MCSSKVITSYIVFGICPCHSIGTQIRDKEFNLLLRVLKNMIKKSLLPTVTKGDVVMYTNQVLSESEEGSYGEEKNFSMKLKLLIYIRADFPIK